MIVWDVLLTVKRFAREEPVKFWFSAGINVLVGGMAIWLGPCLAMFDPVAHPMAELIQTFRQGNGYLFSLALLAASSAFVFNEYYDGKLTEYRSVKVGVFAITIALMAIMGLLLVQFATAGLGVDDAQKSHVQRLVPTNSAVWAQVVLTFLSLVIASVLWCLSMIDEHEGIGKILKDNARRDLNRDMEKAPKNNELKL
jgi:hypothetical protein